ncbi:MAG: hypothetical protein H6739_32020 [Alphaproteobacteria bacterium]|nr:hypothetical protein [Alphaproteobacteria bacterium]
MLLDGAADEVKRAGWRASFAPSEAAETYQRSSPEFDGLRELHLWLAGRLQVLRAERPRECRVYLIEHGLPKQIVRDVLPIALKDALAARNISAGARPFWDARVYPLLVYLTELGYRYGGSVRQLWPPAEEELEHSLSPAERASIREYFLGLVDLTAVRPPDTSWVQHFRNIAWPIAHAALPLELHVPLLQAALSLGRFVDNDTDDDAILEPLQAWAGAASHKPLLHFLDSGPLAADVVRGLLVDDAEPRVIDAGLIERITSDLRQSRLALATLNAARARQSQLRWRGDGGGRSRGGEDAEPCAEVRGQLLLSWEFGRPELYLRPPRLVPELRQAFRTTAARAKLSLLGGRSIRARALLDGQPLKVTARDLPTPGPDGTSAPLVSGLTSSRGLGEFERLQLSPLCVDVARPLVFNQVEGELTAAQRRQRSYVAGDLIWLLVEQIVDEDTSWMQRYGRVAGLHCVRVDTSAPQAAPWLHRRGLNAVEDPKADLVGAPHLRLADSDSATLFRDDVVALLLERDPAEALSADDGESRLLEPGLFLLPADLEAGEWSLSLRARGGAARKQRLLVEVDEQRAGVGVHMELSGAALTVDSLRRGEFKLALSSDTPFEGLQVALSLLAGELILARASSAPLDALPATIEPSAPVWQALLDAAGDGLAKVLGEPLVLRAELGGLVDQQWWLEPTESQVWWRRTHSGAWEPVSEDLEDIFAEMYVASAPLERVADLEAALASGDVVLTQPVAPSGQGARPLLGAGRCASVSELDWSALHEPPTPPRRLLRMLDSRGVAGTGAAELVDAYLCWSTASAVDLVAEARRRRVFQELERWLVEALCGEQWVWAEQRLRGHPPGTIGAHVLAALRHEGLGRDPLSEDFLAKVAGSAGLRELEERTEARLTEAAPLLEEFAEASPQGRLEQLAAELDGELQRASLEAMKVALGVSLDGPLPEHAEPFEPDPGVDALSARRVIRAGLHAWRADVEAAALVRWIYPPGAAEALRRMDYSEAAPVAELVRWLRDRPRGTATWPSESITELLHLWLDPTKVRARTPELKSAVLLGLADQAASRAIRYAALRRSWCMRGLR